jgi:NAD-dependent SIR2 family protein deacetylase
MSIKEKQVGVNEVLSELNKFKEPKICFLTGAGLSVASGLPTFRGAGGIWTN